MKTKIKMVMQIGLKLTFLCLIFISINLKINAQEELKRTFLKLSYTKNSDETKTLKAAITYKEDKKFVPVQYESIGFYSGADLDELIENVELDSKGIASLIVPDDIVADSLGFYNFAAKFKGTDILKRASTEISVKDARLELTFNQKSDGKLITVKAFEVSDEEGDIPISEEEIFISVPTLFGDMRISKSSLDEGSCELNFPSDLPGDSLGNLNISAKIIDSEVYGNVVKEEIIPWGKPKVPQHIQKTNAKGKLWTPNAPFWMVVTLTILLLGVWSHFGYVIFKMYKINKAGAEK